MRASRRRRWGRSAAAPAQPRCRPPAGRRRSDGTAGNDLPRPGRAVGIFGGRGAGEAALAGIRITPDVANNSLLIYASQETYRIVEQTLRQIDRPQLQVAIDATVAEVTLNDALNYGVQYFLTVAIPEARMPSR